MVQFPSLAWELLHAAEAAKKKAKKKKKKGFLEHSGYPINVC